MADKTRNLLDLPTELLLEIVGFVIHRPAESLYEYRGGREIADALVNQYVLLSTCKVLRELTPAVVRPSALPGCAQAWLLLRLEYQTDWLSVPLPKLLRDQAQERKRQEDELTRRDYLSQPADRRPPWATHLTPRSVHACLSCRRLKGSHCFASTQVTRAFAKPRDSKTPPESWLKNNKPPGRLCLDCMPAKAKPTTNPIRWVEGWEADHGIGVETAQPAVFGVGFQCSNWNCRAIVKAVTRDPSEGLPGGLESMEYLRRQCTKCLLYRDKRRVK